VSFASRNTLIFYVQQFFAKLVSKFHKDGARAAAHRAQADAPEIEAGAKRCLGRRKDVTRPRGGLGR
jgi:hypothetical protein